MTSPDPAKSTSRRSRTGRRGRSSDRERRVITVLFCDVVGSTSMAEQLDPEDWTEIMDEAFGHMTGPVERYGGTIGRFMGDAIVAFFGAPSAHEDDPERAVRAGLEIISGIQDFKGEIDDEFEVDFNVRVGINTGPVVVGMVGSQDPGDYTAMGDTVNVAARMEQTAEAATVQVSEATYSLTAPRFEYESLGGISVKGKLEPVPTFKALSISESGSSPRGGRGTSTRIVGREDELDILRSMANEVIHGNGQIVSLIAEAGLGKSRMIQELREYWADMTDGQGGWSELRGISFDEYLPYGVFLPRMRQLLGVDESDSPEIVEEKILARLENAPEDSADFIQRMADVLRSLVPRGGRPPLEGEALEQVIYQTAIEFWEREASEVPTVLVVDDLHWSDEASQELLIYLLNLLKSRPIMFLYAFRPERDSAAWRAKEAIEADFADRYTEITLEPLSSDDTDSLVDSLLNVEDMPPDVLRTLHRRADGNPYFIEEMVRSLIESDAVASNGAGLRWQAGADARSIAIPDNVQSLLMTRLDRLDAESRRTLQLAAVIGRRFPREVLSRLVDDPSVLDAQFAGFLKMELIDETARTPELEYTFRHQLTRDAAYNSILRRERRRSHRQVAEALEQHHGEKAEEEAHRLGYHYREGGDAERGGHFYRLAAERAARLHANREAISLYVSALGCVDDEHDDEEQVTALYTGRGRAMEISGDYESALENYREFGELAGRRNSKSLQLAALIPQATIYSTLNTQLDPTRGESISRRTVELAQELGDHRAESRAYWNLMLLDAYAGGEPENASEMGERAVAIAREHGLKEELAYALNDLARPYLALGRHDDLTAGLEESLQLWRELDNQPMLSDCLIKLADAKTTVGELERAMDASREALSIARASRNTFGEVIAMMRISIVHAEEAKVEESIAELVEAAASGVTTGFAPALLLNARLALARAEAGDLGGTALAEQSVSDTAAFPAMQRFALIALARMHAHTGERTAGTEALKQSTELPALDISNPVSSYGYIQTVEMDAMLQLGDLSPALDYGERVLSGMQAYGMRLRVPDVLRLLAVGYAADGRIDEARKALADALAAAESVGSKRALWQVLAAIGTFEAGCGNDSACAAARDRARSILEEVIAAITDIGLKERFAAQPIVQEILG